VAGLRSSEPFCTARSWSREGGSGGRGAAGCSVGRERAICGGASLVVKEMSWRDVAAVVVGGHQYVDTRCVLA
jgi:hypothetical protein